MELSNKDLCSQNINLDQNWRKSRRDKERLRERKDNRAQTLRQNNNKAY